MTETIIRAVAAADIPAIAALARAIWLDHYPAIISVEQIEYMLAERYSPAQMREEIDGGTIGWEQIVVDGAPVAFASYFASEMPGEMKLDKLYVHPGHQRAGYGGKLIAHVAAVAANRGFRRLILAVNKNNVQAIGAYRKHGFAVRESVTKEIGNGFVMDDYVMVKELTA
jgi:ribosomal protein S18 acetylase RimI-like enzyme